MTDLTEQQREALEALATLMNAPKDDGGDHDDAEERLRTYILNSTPVPEEASQELDQIPSGDHPDDRAVVEFSHAMRKKMADARAKGRSGWDTDACLDAQLAQMLVEHTFKANGRSNFVDVGNLAMMLWYRQAPPSELAIAAHGIASEHRAMLAAAPKQEGT